MKYKLFFTVIFIFIAFLLSAEINISEDYTIEIDSLEYSIGTIEEKYVTQSSKCSVMISIDTLALILNNDEQEKIEIYVKDFLLDTFSTYSDKIKTFISGFKSAYSEYTEDMPRWIWEEQYSTHVLYNNNNIISIKLSVFGYTGGAHPYGYLDYLNFDIITGDKIELTDIFKTNYKDKLDSIAEIIFREYYGFSDDESLSELGFDFDDNKFTLNNNFSINDNGLYFYYNQYEIACYAAGTFAVEIPYINIKDLIKVDSPIDKLY